MLTPAQLQELKLENEQVAARQENKGKTSYIKLVEGAGNILRILPAAVAGQFPWHKSDQHWNLGKHGVGCPMSTEGSCVVCNYIAKLKQSGAKPDLDLAEKLKLKTAYLMNVIVRGQEALGVQVWSACWSIYNQVIKLVTNEEWGDITDANTGVDLQITRTTEPRQTKYALVPNSPVRVPLANMDWLTTMYDLTTLHPIYTNAELTRLLNNEIALEDLDKEKYQAQDNFAAQTATTPTVAAVSPVTAPPVVIQQQQQQQQPVAVQQTIQPVVQPAQAAGLPCLGLHFNRLPACATCASQVACMQATTATATAPTGKVVAQATPFVQQQQQPTAAVAGVAPAVTPFAQQPVAGVQPVAQPNQDKVRAEIQAAMEARAAAAEIPF